MQHSRCRHIIVDIILMVISLLPSSSSSCGRSHPHRVCDLHMSQGLGDFHSQGYSDPAQILAKLRDIETANPTLAKVSVAAGLVSSM